MLHAVCAECPVSRSVSSLQPQGLWPAGRLCPWDSPDKNPGVGCHALLQGVFPTQGLNPGPPHHRCGFFTIWGARESLWPNAQDVNYTNLSVTLSNSCQQPWMITVPRLPEAVASEHHWTSIHIMRGKEKRELMHTHPRSLSCLAFR